MKAPNSNSIAEFGKLEGESKEPCWVALADDQATKTPMRVRVKPINNAKTLGEIWIIVSFPTNAEFIANQTICWFINLDQVGT